MKKIRSRHQIAQNEKNLGNPKIKHNKRKTGTSYKNKISRSNKVNNIFVLLIE